MFSLYDIGIFVGIAIVALVLTNALVAFARMKRFQRIDEKAEQLCRSRSSSAISDDVNQDENTPPIPVTIVTGFLGSGKTTLLNYILRSTQHGRKIAVIENEFGAVSVDHELLKNAQALNNGIFVMANGCICCSAGGPGDELERILDRLLALANTTDPSSPESKQACIDYVIIETTGMADPAPIVQTFFRSEMAMSKFVLDGIVTVVDAKHIQYHLENGGWFSRAAEAETQIAYADVILLNKVDLVDSKIQRQKICQEIGQINPTAKIIQCQLNQAEINNKPLENNTNSIKSDSTNQLHSYQENETETIFQGVPLDMILDINAFDLDHIKLEKDKHVMERSARHTHDIGSTVLYLPKSQLIDANKLRQWLSNLLEKQWQNIFRVKGFLWVDGSTDPESDCTESIPRRFVIQGVHSELMGDYIQSDPQSEEDSHLVFIGRALDRTFLLEGFKSTRCDNTPLMQEKVSHIDTVDGDTTQKTIQRRSKKKHNA